jgi:hypothetical protein
VYFYIAKQIDRDTKPAFSQAGTSFLQKGHLQYTFPVRGITFPIIFIHTKNTNKSKY